MFQTDASTAHRFGGNPAAVVLLDRFREDAVTQVIAAENNLAETAFLCPEGDGSERCYRQGAETGDMS